MRDPPRGWFPASADRCFLAKFSSCLIYMPQITCFSFVPLLVPLLPLSSPSLPFLSPPDPSLVVVHPSVWGGPDLGHIHICFTAVSPPSGWMKKILLRLCRGPGRCHRGFLHCLTHGRHWARAARALGPEGLGLEPALLLTRHQFLYLQNRANPTYFRAVARHK